MKVTIIIPARMAATRFPGKPLFRINGKPMIQWVYQRCRMSRADQVIVATDSEEIAQVVSDFGGRAAMTSANHINGTQRIAEVAATIDADILINVQGDEPTIDPRAIDAVIQPFETDARLEMTTLAEAIGEKDDLFNPHVVKVVFDQNQRALYFSRAPIPFVKHPEMNSIDWEADDLSHHFRHVGIYGFRRRFLLEFVGQPPCRLEEMEGLEQLRALYMGASIHVGVTPYPSIGVDTPEDAVRAENYLKKEGRVS